MATEYMAQAYEQGDPRKNATLLYFRHSDDEPITPENTNEPYGESPVSPAMGAYFNKKAYTDPALRKEYTNKGYWVNIRLIRYADVLLMGAESANEKGIPGEAVDYLEQVRARARGTNSNILPKVTTTDQGELREAIRHERRVELGLEFDRFYDLVRWGIAKQVLQAAGKNYQDMNRFIDALMRRMTLEEKIGQLNLPVTGEITTGQAKSSDIAAKIKKGEVGGLFNLKGVEKIREVQKQAVEQSRLGIPLLFGMDVIHGYETMFPIPLGLSCTWDMAAIEESARIAAVEASADGISWTFSPMVDISRDPRWGRVSEGSGEDPFLGAMIAEAMVRGYQGKNMQRNDEIMACVKHFALYGAGEAGRDYNTVDMSRQRMFNDYMLPYEAAVEAGVGSVMASFNEVDGIPSTANKWLMTDILRGQWGFNGFVVTDYTGISEMIDHGIGDLQTVSARAINAGVDMDMVSEGFVGTLKKSVQ